MTFKSIKVLLSTLCMLCASFLLSQTQLGADINGEILGDWFGQSVEMSADGNRMAIGASSNGSSFSYAGHVKIYELSNGNWSQLGQNIEGEGADDQSGYSVSISGDGNRVAIGAIGNSGGAGHVRIYEYMGGSWVQMGANLDGDAPSNAFGIGLKLSNDGNRVAIGAHTHDGTNGPSSGQAKVFEYDGTEWTQLGSELEGDQANDRFGFSVSLSEDATVLAVGGYRNNSNTGHVKVFELSGGDWVLKGNIIQGESFGDFFGYSVELSADGNRVVCGARNNSNGNGISGHARIFEFNGNDWQQLGNDIDGEMEGDFFGSKVDISADGSLVAIGAYRNDGGGEDSGRTKLYHYSDGDWQQLGTNINGSASNDESGRALSLSLNGQRIAIGARKNGAGYVRVFDLPCSCSAYKNIPQTAGEFTGACSQIDDDGWIHYCDENNNLLLSLAPDSSGLVAQANEVSLKIENPIATHFEQYCGNTASPCFIDLAGGVTVFQRSWNVSPSTQPSAEVGIRFYFNQSEYDALNAEIENQGGAPLTSLEDMWFYKVTNNALGVFPAIPSITTSDVIIISNDGTAPSLNRWELITKVPNQEYACEYKVASFSGGGGGGAADGEIPLPIESVFEEESAYSIFPNPANDFIIIEGKANQAILYNAYGQAIRHLNFSNADKNTVSTSDLNSGLYFLRFANEKGALVGQASFLISN